MFQKLVELIFLNAEKYLIPFTVLCETVTVTTILV